MGRDKAFLPFRDSPLVEHSLGLVRQAGANEVFISGRLEQDFSVYGHQVLHDTKPDCGPLGGIERGLACARNPLLLVMAVDLPHMTVECLGWLLGGCDEATGAVPQLRDQLEPLAAVYPSRAYEIATRMLRAGNLAARQFARNCMTSGFVNELPVPKDHEICFTNWNNPEDCVER